MATRDDKMMALALEEAAKGLGWVSPNPAVGAVLTQDAKVLAKGYHKKFGGPHAEIEVLKQVKHKVSGMTLYVTLEPCAHQGKTPPCVNAIIKSGISRVVIGAGDPHSLVSGRGIEALRKAKVTVKTGVLKETCQNFYAPYVKYVKTGMPYVSLKIAATLDGMVATSEGDSKWITGPETRRYVHKVRSQSDAILVGSNTIVRDNPRLTVRMGVKGRDPVRVILDSTLYLNPDAQIFTLNSKSPTIVATTDRANPEKAKMIQKQKGELLYCSADETGRVDLVDLLKRLGERGILSLIIEGGPVIHSAFLSRGLVDHMTIFLAPKFMGGSGLPMFTGLMPVGLNELPRMKDVQVSRIGGDIIIEGNL